MFRSALVPLDGSPQSASALPQACAIARASGGAVHLLRVVPAGDREAIATATRDLQSIMNGLDQTGLEVSLLVRLGDPASEIINAVRNLGADLIVMATHAKGNQSMLALTSVSRAVLSRSALPVLLVRPESTRTEHIRTLLVPVDGSPGGSLALAAAVALARTTGARLELLQVIVPLNPEEVTAVPGRALGRFIDPAWGNIAVACAEDHVQKLADHLAARGLVCDARVAVGDVAPLIIQYSIDLAADLVVMSTHARSWPGDALVGSNALNVLEHGQRPVLLVHREQLASEVVAR